mgnify:CR=1 FL=1
MPLHHPEERSLIDFQRKVFNFFSVFAIREEGCVEKSELNENHQDKEIGLYDL